MSLTIGIDIGGTKLVAGVVDNQGNVLAVARQESPASDPEAIEAAVEHVVAQLRSKHDVVAVGIGAAGFIDADRSRVLFAPNLAWRNEPLRADLERRLNLPVVVENDANAAAWGEYRFGLGEDSTVLDLLLVTVGTGIGGGIVMNGQLHRGAFGIAAEFGHMRVVPEGHLCGCGNRGCWEQYASGNALVRNTRDAAASEPTAAARLLDAVGSADGIDGPAITEAARAGDEFSVSQLATIGMWLGEGISSLAAAFDPALVLIGGGVSEAGGLVVQPAAEAFRCHLPAAEYRPIARIRRASLGNQAGLVGAADLARVT